MEENNLLGGVYVKLTPKKRDIGGKTTVIHPILGWITVVIHPNYSAISGLSTQYFEKEELDSYNSPEPVPSKVYMERTLEKSFGLMSIINRNQVLVEKIMDHQTVILKAGETICDSPRRRSVMDSGRHPTDYPRRLGGMD